MYDQRKSTPRNFPTEIIRANTNNFLWVSDPHFSTDHHAFPREAGGLSKYNLSEAIRRDLAALNITSLGGLLISGDLTWKAASDEFDWAKKFVDDIQSWATLGSSQILVCPGNHDLAFSNDPSEKGVPATVVGDASSKEYRRLHELLFKVKPNEAISSGRHFWLPSGQAVDIVSLNTSLLQQFPDALQGQGFLGARQLDEAAKEMEWSSERLGRKAYRICMLHHHVVPIIHREHPRQGIAASVVHDAGALMRWLTENEVDLVIHGHMHLPTIVKCSLASDYPDQAKWHQINIAALGSSGVVASHRPETHNTYGLIQFTRDGVEIIVRNISADDSIPLEKRVVFSALLPIDAPRV